MSTDEEKRSALVPVQSTALTKAGAKSLAARGRYHLREKEEAEEWLRKGLALQEAAPADPRARCGGPLNPHAKRWLLRNDSFLFRGIEQQGEMKQEQWRRRKDALKEALRCFERGHKLDPNNSELLYCLADSSYRENETEENEVKAVSLYQRAADLGHTGAQLAIADAYTQCGFRCLPVDERRALKWFQAAAEQGDEDGLSGFLRYYEPSMDADSPNAIVTNLILKAAKQGDSRAQYTLGLLYDRGQGVPQDSTQATRWLRMAASNGNYYAKVHLGLDYLTGRRVPRDYAEEALWARCAASQVDDGKFQLNLNSPPSWLGLAAAQGYANAYYLLGWLYYHGHGVPLDYAQAAIWYGRAAEQGDDEAQYLLGVLYDNGQGVLQDDVQAIFWIRKAAEQGNTDAQVSLGLAYKAGHGVTQDDAQAAIWLRKGRE